MTYHCADCGHTLEAHALGKCLAELRCPCGAPEAQAPRLLASREAVARHLLEAWYGPLQALGTDPATAEVALLKTLTGEVRGFLDKLEAWIAHLEARWTSRPPQNTGEQP